MTRDEGRACTLTIDIISRMNVLGESSANSDPPEVTNDDNANIEEEIIEITEPATTELVPVELSNMHLDWNGGE